MSSQNRGLIRKWVHFEKTRLKSDWEPKRMWARRRSISGLEAFEPLYTSSKPYGSTEADLAVGGIDRRIVPPPSPFFYPPWRNDTAHPLLRSSSIAKGDRRDGGTWRPGAAEKREVLFPGHNAHVFSLVKYAHNKGNFSWHSASGIFKGFSFIFHRVDNRRLTLRYWKPLILDTALVTVYLYTQKNVTGMTSFMATVSQM